MIHWQEWELHKLLDVPVQMFKTTQETSRAIRVPHPELFPLHSRPCRGGPQLVRAPRTFPDQLWSPDPPESLLTMIAGMLPRQVLNEPPEVLHVGLDDHGGEHVNYSHLGLGFRYGVGVIIHSRG